MKSIGRDLMQPGIYCIICISTSKRYVGSSVNMYQRLLSHRAYLRHNVHHNKKLQNSWNKHKEEDFDYYILEFCDREFLRYREQHFMDTMKPEFNIDIIVTERVIRGEESIRKQSETRKERMASGLIKTNCAKKIFQYDLDGNFIMEHDSIRKASVFNEITVGCIEKFLYGVKYRKGGGYLWSYTYVEKMPPYVKFKAPSPTMLKKVVMLDLSTNEKIEFPSIGHCARFLNKGYGMVRWYFNKQSKIQDKYMIYSIDT